MKKIKTFWHTLKNSLSNPHYANDVFQAPTSFSMQFYTAMVILLALGISIFSSFTIALFPLQKNINSVIAQFPNDLVFTIQNNTWSINQPLPYTLSTDIFGENPSQPFLTLTTDEAMPNPEAFRNSGAFLALTTTQLYSYANENRFQIQSIDLTEGNLPDFTLSQSTLQNYADTFFSHPLISLRLYAPIIGIFIFITLFIFLWPIIMLSVVFYSFLVWVLNKIIFKKNNSFTYGQVFQLSLHSIWLLEILNWLVLNHIEIPFSDLIKLIIFGSWTLILLNNYQPIIPKTTTKNNKVKTTRSSKNG